MKPRYIAALVVALILFMSVRADADERQFTSGGQFVEIGIAYKIPSHTSWQLYPGCIDVPLWSPRGPRPKTVCGGRNPMFHFKWGFETRTGYSFGWHHISHVRDGYPFNERMESWTDSLFITKRWGGRR